MPWDTRSLYQPSQRLKLASWRNNKPSILFVNGLLCQRLIISGFSFDFCWWTFVGDFFCATVIVQFAFDWCLIGSSLPKFSVVVRLKHPSFNSWISLRYVWCSVLVQGGKILAGFTNQVMRSDVNQIQAKQVWIRALLLLKVRDGSGKREGCYGLRSVNAGDRRICVVTWQLVRLIPTIGVFSLVLLRYQ